MIQRTLRQVLNFLGMSMEFRLQGMLNESAFVITSSFLLNLLILFWAYVRTTGKYSSWLLKTTRCGWKAFFKITGQESSLH